MRAVTSFNEFESTVHKYSLVNNEFEDYFERPEPNIRWFLFLLGDTPYMRHPSATPRHPVPQFNMAEFGGSRFPPCPSLYQSYERKSGQRWLVSPRFYFIN